MNKICLLVCLSCTSFMLVAQNEFNQKIAKLAESKALKYANVSISAFDIETKNQILNYRAEKSLIPASSIKLIPSLIALELFGHDYTFETKLMYDGQLESDGTLLGNVYIEGSGDPTLGFNRFKSTKPLKELLDYMSDAISSAGITCIEGHVIADESAFDSYPVCPSWQWNDLGNYYAGGAWGLNINENQYYLYFGGRSKIGLRPRIKFHEPFIEGLQFSNEVFVDSPGTGDQAYIFGGPYDYLKRVSGTIPQGNGLFRIRGSIPDPPLFVAQNLAKSLEEKNIHSYEAKTQFRPDYRKRFRKEIIALASPPLGEIVKETIFHSLNLHAEAMFKAICYSKYTTASGSRSLPIIKKRMKRAGIDIKGMHLEDGSGLSARNQISSQVLSSFIMYHANLHGPEKLTEYIPKAGSQGTVSSFSQKKGVSAWLKSGSMNRIQSYTGLIKNKQGKWISFSFIANGFDGKNSSVVPVVRKIIYQLYLEEI
jgi:D-alanyl-D-alanine carboxypeptidase/D-alanyl-D-alanine-endopeptidase (penicillin-binding protein 4)